MNKLMIFLLMLLASEALLAKDTNVNKMPVKIPSWLNDKIKHSTAGELKYGTFSSDAGRYYYELGGTDLTPPSLGSFSNNTTLLDFEASAGVSYSCANLSANYASTLAQMNKTIKELPNSVKNMANQALKAGIAALPMYILNEANPVLAQVFSNSMFTLDENFRMSVKSCEQLESSILSGNGVGDWVTFNISKGMQNQLKGHEAADNNPETASATNITADDFVSTAQQNASCSNTTKSGVQWLEGGFYGAKNKPLLIEEHTVIAGYNSLRGYKYSKNGVGLSLLNDTHEANQEQRKNKPIMRQWTKPLDAANFVKSVIGSTQVTLCNGEKADVAVSMAPGRTLKAEYDKYNETFKQILIKMIYQPQDVTEKEYKSLGSLEISTELLEKIRRQQRNTQMLTISKLASAYAYEKARMLALDAINLMRIGSQTQYIASATPAKKYIDGAIKRLNDDISDLKQSAEQSKAANTILQILDN